jgi:hypothetical protein
MSIETDDPLALTPENDHRLEQALRRAVRAALLEHKRAGNPVASWKDGRVVLIPPEEIGVGDEPHEEAG